MRRLSNRAWVESLDISALFWITVFIPRLSQVSEFEKFASAKATGVDHQAVIGGFRQVSRVLLHEFQSSFQANTFLRLKSDRTTDRAVFAGVPYDRLPPTSEKANAIKNLALLIDKANRAKDSVALAAALKALDRRVSKPLLQIFDSSVSKTRLAPARLSRREMLFCCGIYYLWAIAHDSDRLAPLYSSPLDSLAMQDPRELSARKQWDYFFLGYKLGVAYLWKELLPVESVEIVNRILSSSDWDDFSEIYSPCRDMMHKAVESRGMTLPLGNEFRSKGQPKKQALAWLLKQTPYPKLTLNQKVDELLYWYQSELIDSARSKIFSGGATLNSLLVGEVMERRGHGMGKKLQVIRFKHPGESRGEAPWFSYGILMERHGTISDFSGWLVFTEVGGDYAGLGGTEYFLVESMLRTLRDSVAVRESIIGVKELRNYFMAKLHEQADETPPHSFSQTDYVRFRVDDLERTNSGLIGRTIEFLAKLYFEESGLQTSIYFRDSSVLPRDQEIDVLAIDKKSKTLVMVECSTNLPIQRIDDFISELNSKAEALMKSVRFSGFRHVRKVFVTTRRTFESLRDKEDIIGRLRSAEIRLLTVEEDIIPHLRRDYRREELQRFFGQGRGQSSLDFA